MKILNHKSKIINFQNGFTLIELVVSISIFTVISGIIVANLRSGTLRDELILDATGLVEAIRDAQTKTTAGELVKSMCRRSG